MPTPRPSATLILLRDAPGSPEAAGSADAAGSPQVLLLERHARSPVLPAMSVFPGGGVDAGDAALARALASGAAQHEARARLADVPAEQVLACCVAALRETFEEVGILLARRRGSAALLSGAESAALQPQRPALQSGPERFAELLAAQDLELALDALVAHGHWVTPAAVQPRFDTLFFTALAPAGQSAQADGVESSACAWLAPAQALEQARSGARRMIFPTACNLETLCGFNDARGALAASRARRIARVEPSIVERAGQRVFELPQESGYRIAAGFERAPALPPPPSARD